MENINSTPSEEQPFTISANLGNGDMEFLVVPVINQESEQKEFKLLLDDHEIGVIQRVSSDIQGWEWLSGTFDLFNADEVGEKISSHYDK